MFDEVYSKLYVGIMANDLSVRRRRIYRVGQKLTHFFWYLNSLLDPLYLQFLFTHVSFSLNDVVLVCRCKQVLFLCE